MIGYWNSCKACQRHMLWLGAVPDTVPLGCTAGLLFCQVVLGPSKVSLADVTTG